MKTIQKIFAVIVLMVLVVAPAGAVTYPQTSFRSTSSMVARDALKQAAYGQEPASVAPVQRYGFSAIATVPTIGADGMAQTPIAVEPASMGAPARVSRPRYDTPGDDDDDGTLPIGDALWPLLLLAALYAAVRALIRVIRAKRSSDASPMRLRQ